MPCYEPIAAFRCADGSIVFQELKRHNIMGDVKIACGQCTGCRIDRSREWSVRCLHEAKQHSQNSFTTLTYSDENLPPGNTLRYSDFQKFIRALRKKTDREVRFFMCGEYGETSKRAHYHALLFGYQFPDLQPWGRSPTGHQLYRSQLLETLWKHGNSLIGEVTKESAGYVARYCMKKVTGERAKEHYAYIDTNGTVAYRTPEFARMSLKPGIGAGWFTKYKDDMLPRDYVIADGTKIPVPKYYDKLFKRSKGDIETVKERRIEFATKQRDNNTPERLKARHEVAKAKLKLLKREL